VKDAVLRENIVALLEGGSAHLTTRDVLLNVDPTVRTLRRPEISHSIWELLEHMRIAQEDILRYTLDPDWISPEYPAGYWPPESSEVSEEAWNGSVSGFFSDLVELVELARDQSLDLCAKIPHGGDHTYLRELLLAADHNAYHLGQIVQLKKLLHAQ
jgi:hypothetical protein